jgi:hypothetical protein
VQFESDWNLDCLLLHHPSDHSERQWKSYHLQIWGPLLSIHLIIIIKVHACSMAFKNSKEVPNWLAMIPIHDWFFWWKLSFIWMKILNHNACNLNWIQKLD